MNISASLSELPIKIFTRHCGDADGATVMGYLVSTATDNQYCLTGPRSLSVVAGRPFVLRKAERLCAFPVKLKLRPRLWTRTGI